MPSSSTSKMSLPVFSSSDPFTHVDFNNAFQKLDSQPGNYICTSTSRPTWGPAQAGQTIFETDSGFYLTWSGTGWAVGSNLLTGMRTTGGYVASNLTLSAGSTTNITILNVDFGANNVAELWRGLSVFTYCCIGASSTTVAYLSPTIDGVPCGAPVNANIGWGTVLNAPSGFQGNMYVPLMGAMGNLSNGTHSIGVQVVMSNAYSYSAVFSFAYTNALIQYAPRA